MARANVLMSANVRRAQPQLPLELSGRGLVMHAHAMQRGQRDRWLLSWQSHDIDFTRYLLDHYRQNRRATFDVDLHDGKGYQAFQYASAPRVTANRSGRGTYSVEIQKAEVS